MFRMLTFLSVVVCSKRKDRECRRKELCRPSRESLGSASGMFKSADLSHRIKENLSPGLLHRIKEPKAKKLSPGYCSVDWVNSRELGLVGHTVYLFILGE